MSAATGVGVEALSALSYAAKQTGVDIGALQGGLKGLAKFTGNVAAGSKGAIQTLQQLGISASTFMAARPEQRLALLADGLQTIPDPGVRAALAMKTLGRAGEALLPMLADGSAGLNAFISRAQELGIVITDEEARRPTPWATPGTISRPCSARSRFRRARRSPTRCRRSSNWRSPGLKAVAGVRAEQPGLVIALATAAVAGSGRGRRLPDAGGNWASRIGRDGGLNAVIAIASARGPCSARSRPAWRRSTPGSPRRSRPKDSRRCGPRSKRWSCRARWAC
jgi:hypothetical protein